MAVAAVERAVAAGMWHQLRATPATLCTQSAGCNVPLGVGSVHSLFFAATAGSVIRQMTDESTAMRTLSADVASMRFITLL